MTFYVPPSGLLRCACQSSCRLVHVTQPVPWVRRPQLRQRVVRASIPAPALVRAGSPSCSSAPDCGPRNGSRSSGADLDRDTGGRARTSASTRSRQLQGVPEVEPPAPALIRCAAACWRPWTPCRPGSTRRYPLRAARRLSRWGERFRARHWHPALRATGVETHRGSTTCATPTPRGRSPRGRRPLFALSRREWALPPNDRRYLRAQARAGR